MRDRLRRWRWRTRRALIRWRPVRLFLSWAFPLWYLCWLVGDREYSHMRLDLSYWHDAYLYASICDGDADQTHVKTKQRIALLPNTVFGCTVREAAREAIKGLREQREWI